MKITVDISPAVHHHAGLGRYAQELLMALLQIDSEDKFQATYYSSNKNQRPDPPLDRIPSQIINLSAKPWRFSVLLSYLTRTTMDRWLPPGDVFHATDHLLPRLGKSKSVFTVHDLIFRFYPQYHLPLNRWYLTLMLPRFMRQADAIIAVSENTRRDVSRLVNIPAEKITVVYEGVSPEFRPIEDEKALGDLRSRLHLASKFILYFGTIEPRKNLLTLLKAYKSLLENDVSSPDLVLAGGKGWLYQPVLEALRELGLDSRVHMTGRVSEEDAPRLLNAAEIFVYPSYYEGFGLPPLEAMACGLPVICSNTSSLPEVVGDAAELFDPNDVQALLSSMKRLLADPGRRKELSARGLRQARKFSWEKAARQTQEIYRRVGC